MNKQLRLFGLFQDGAEIKVALLVADKDSIQIKDLQKIKLPESDVPATPDTLFEDALSDLDFDFGMDDTPTEDKSAPSKGSEDFGIMDVPDSKDKDQAPQKEEKTFDILAQEMDLANGTISLNLDIANVNYKDFDIPPKTKKRKILSEIKKQFFDEESPTVMSFSYFRRHDGSIVGVNHEGKMELLENLIHVNRSVSKKSYHYSYIQPNEFALINALRYNYSIRSDDISAIIYIGQDFSRITLTKGYDFLLDLPIINEGYRSKDAIKTIFSRLMLERSHIDLPNIHNYFLAGEGLNDEMFEFVYERQPDANVKYLIPQKLCEQNDYTGTFTEEQLAEFIIPIMLAIPAALPKDTTLLKSNFLPKQLKEQQNILSISTEGFLVLGLMLIVGLVGINLVLQQQETNSKIVLENTALQSQIRVNQAVMDSIYVLSSQIQNIELNIARSNTLIGENNQWHFILEKISNNFHRNRLSWLSSIKSEGNGFRLTGKTTNRLNIIRLSRLFPESKIHSISEEIIQEHTIWHYEISFDFPDPLETKRLNYLRESKITNLSLPNYENIEISPIITDKGDSYSDSFQRNESKLNLSVPDMERSN